MESNIPCVTVVAPVDEAAVAEITDLLPASTLAAYALGRRVIVRRESVHSGARPTV